jgi:hypothetical protein
MPLLAVFWHFLGAVKRDRIDLRRLKYPLQQPFTV